MRLRSGSSSVLQGLEEGGGSTDTASTSKSKQDSGLGRTDDSVRTEESSEQVRWICICLDFLLHKIEPQEGFYQTK